MADPAIPLRRLRDFRTLWFARFVSFTGDSLALVALILYLATHRDNAFAVAALLIVGDLAPKLLSPWTATLSDRIPLRTLMIWCELIQALLIAAAIVTLDRLAALLICVFARSLVAQTSQPAFQASIVRLVDDERLESANAAMGLGTFGLEAVGAALAALLITFVGVRGALGVDAASFVFASVLLMRLPPLEHAERRESEVTIRRDAVDGLRYVARDHLLRAVVIGFAVFVAFIAIDDVALVFLGTQTLHASQAATALLYSGAGVGMFAGFVALTRRSKTQPAALLLAGFVVTAVGNLLTGLAWAVGIAIAMQAVRGLGTSAVDVGSSTLLQRAVPADMLGRAFGNLYGAVGLAAGVSYLVGGLLLQSVSPRTVFVIAGCGGLLAAAGTAVAIRHTERGVAP